MTESPTAQGLTNYSQCFFARSGAKTALFALNFLKFCPQGGGNPEKYCIFAVGNTKTRNMATMTIPQQMPDTFTLTVPKADVNFIKTIAKKMGWSIKRIRGSHV